MQPESEHRAVAGPTEEWCDIPLHLHLLLSVQRGLLGEVTPALRGVTVGLRWQTVLVRYYLDGPISDDDKDGIGAVGAEVIADFPSPWMIEEDIVRRDFPEPMESLSCWAYLRSEWVSEADGKARPHPWITDLQPWG